MSRCGLLCLQNFSFLQCHPRADRSIGRHVMPLGPRMTNNPEREWEQRDWQCDQTKRSKRPGSSSETSSALRERLLGLRKDASPKAPLPPLHDNLLIWIGIFGDQIRSTNSRRFSLQTKKAVLRLQFSTVLGFRIASTAISL
jgi:hypothetical protein